MLKTLIHCLRSLWYYLALVQRGYLYKHRLNAVIDNRIQSLLIDASVGNVQLGLTDSDQMNLSGPATQFEHMRSLFPDGKRVDQMLFQLYKSTDQVAHSRIILEQPKFIALLEELNNLYQAAAINSDEKFADLQKRKSESSTTSNLIFKDGSPSTQNGLSSINTQRALEERQSQVRLLRSGMAWVSLKTILWFIASACAIVLEIFIIGTTVLLVMPADTTIQALETWGTTFVGALFFAFSVERGFLPLIHKRDISYIHPTQWIFLGIAILLSFALAMIRVGSVVPMGAEAAAVSTEEWGLALFCLIGGPGAALMSALCITAMKANSRGSGQIYLLVTQALSDVATLRVQRRTELRRIKGLESATRLQRDELNKDEQRSERQRRRSLASLAQEIRQAERQKRDLLNSTLSEVRHNRSLKRILHDTAFEIAYYSLQDTTGSSSHPAVKHSNTPIVIQREGSIKNGHLYEQASTNVQ